MNGMNRFFSLVVVLMLASAAWAQDKFAFGTATNPQGKRIEVDSKGFVIDGRRVLPVMGEVHYSRVPCKDWRREIRKMKAGGITILSTYVFWIHHEPVEGEWDWTGNNDLHQFLQICREEEMPVVLRVGPFCHGEVYQGGFPVWLVEKALSNPKEYRLRSEAAGFMAATRRLYSNIFAQVKDMLWKEGGTVIGMQIENECRGPWSYYMALKDMAVEIGFDLPFYTRTGWPKLNGKEDFGKMLPLYGDYADGFWDRVLTDMPGDYAKAFTMKDARLSTVIATETFSKDELQEQEGEGAARKVQEYPYLTCELGGGMMPSYHRRINISGQEILPLAICKLGSGSNLLGYYMYHGGTNPYCEEHSMAETQASPVTNYNDMPLLSYDFQAPLGEVGQPNWIAFNESRYLHQFLKDWGGELAEMDVDTLSEHYSRRGCFEFRNTYTRILNEKGSASITMVDMPWEGMKISSASVQPFAKADGGLYFLPVEGEPSYNILVDGKKISLKPNKTKKVKGKNFTLLSWGKAKTAYVIDGKMHYAKNNGILYKHDDGSIAEECWDICSDLRMNIKWPVNKEVKWRDVKMGSQKVASMPTDEDFKDAYTFEISFENDSSTPSSLHSGLRSGEFNTSPLNNPDDYFLEIKYKGDVARVYADGKLVQDNFWNGKPMWVRLSDLVGKKVEVKILPLGKDYPIYLQENERIMLKNSQSGLLSFALNLVERRYK